MISSLWCYIDSQCYTFYIISFIVAHFTATSTELMSGAKSREWVHQNSTNQPTNTTVAAVFILSSLVSNCCKDGSIY